MARKTYSRPKLLAHLWHHGEKSKPFLPFDGCENLEDFWVKLARPALTLGNDDDQADREMRLTFKHFNLDHRNPWAWRLLVVYFSHVLFAEKGRRGAKKTWNGDRIMELRREIIKWKLQKAPATTIAKKLRSNKASSFHSESYEQLRIYVGNLRQGEREVFGIVDV